MLAHSRAAKKTRAKPSSGFARVALPPAAPAPTPGPRAAKLSGTGVKPTRLYPRASGAAHADARSPHPAFTTSTDCAKYTAKADTLDNA